MFKKKKGRSGNAVAYMTRSRALKKLQLKLSHFRRLCILKGIFPREPRGKKPKGQKTYYHAKDIAFLQHEPLLAKFREMVAYEKKVRRALGKQNVPAARRLAARRPQYQLDHLVRERYPTFADALRDLDDPLTLISLFAVLPGGTEAGIEPERIRLSRQLSLEWQAWVAKSHALRRVFVTVKGYYLQAEVQGQAVTWLVPHALSQVLPKDVDYRVMTTFLEFYLTLLQFVNFRLYHLLGLRYPPVADARLQRDAAELEGVMRDLAGRSSDQGTTMKKKQVTTISEKDEQEMQRRLQQRVSELEAEVAATAGAVEAEDEDEKEKSAADDEAGENGDIVEEEDSSDLEIDSGDEEEESSDSDSESEGGLSDPETVGIPAEDDDEDKDGAAAEDEDVEELLREENADAFYTTGLNVDPSDDAAVCANLFKGLIFFLGREVPRELLLMTIRSAGGEAAWEGPGSPYEENDERITHQVVDRPTQGHRYLSRVYVQPQWAWDSLNARVLAPTELYFPGARPPPHLSPFVDAEEEGYVPEYGRRLKALREAGITAYRRAHGLAVEGELAGSLDEEANELTVVATEDEEAAQMASRHAAEMAKELEAAGVKAPATPAQETAGAKLGKDSKTEEDAAAMAMAKTMMSRKTRRLYGGLQHGAAVKKARVAKLERRAAAVAKDA